MNTGPPGPLYKRLLWMAAIWLAGVVTLGVVATLIRFAIKQ